MDEKKRLMKSALVVGVATLASRILGFIRDVLIAQLFGTQMRAEAFVIAFRIPNLLRIVIGEGSTNSAVVPVLSRLNQQKQPEEFWQVASCLFNVLLVFLAVLVLFGEIFAPAIVRILAPGFIKDPEKLQLTIRLTRLLFPYILLVSLTAYAMGVLNSLKHFALPALAPCLLNLGLIFGCLVLCPRLSEPADGLAWGVLIGGTLQFLIQIPLLVKKGFYSKGYCGFIHPKVKEIGRLLLPRTLGVTVYQANVFIDSILASLAWIVGEGAVAALYYATRLVQLPLALFGIALAQVALPTLSGLAVKKDFTQLNDTVSFSLRSIFTMMAPATIGMIVLSRPLISVLFERGNFGSDSAAMTASVLTFYCLGLTGYAGIKILASCFYALKDTMTPVKVAALALVMNLTLNLILMWPLKVMGLALATACSAIFNFVLLLSILSQRIGKFDNLGTSFKKITLAALIMGVALRLMLLQAGALASGTFFMAARLMIAMLGGIFVYALALKIIAPEEARMFLGWILKRR